MTTKTAEEMEPVDRDRRRLLTSSAIAFATAGLLTAAPAESAVAVASDAIRPFRVHFREADLAELRRRVLATRWSTKETVSDSAQGIQLDKVRELIRYWGASYDWRRVETRLNALPQFMTRIDGLDIHFIHVRSRHPNALPLIIAHGWPGSVIEQIGTIGPLTDPTAFGGSAEDAFDVVIPSMPGYGFSGKPTTTGWNPDRIAAAWDVLMKRVGYDHYVAQGGDWGSPVVEALGRQAPKGLLGIHATLPAAVPVELLKAVNNGQPAPAGLGDDEKAAFDAVSTFYQKRRGYSVMMATHPQAVGYALSDSPVGLAAWMYDYNDGEPARLLSRDVFLDNVTLYWLTNSATSAARLYWENGGKSPLSSVAQRTAEITVPVAVSVFPDELYRAPRKWVEQAYPTLVYYNRVDRGGHFAAWEQPVLFSAEMRAAFRPLRRA